MSVKKALDSFGSSVVSGSKKELARKKKNASNNLSKSVDYAVKVSKNSFQLDFFMEDYGKFIDKGVRGAGGVRKTTSKFKKTNNKGKLWKIKAKNSEFKFGKAGGVSAKHFRGWSKKKGLSEYAVAKAVYHQGIETTHFFTNTFDKAFKTLPEEVIKAYGLTIEKLLKAAI